MTRTSWAPTRTWPSASSPAFNGIQGKREGNLHFAGEQTSVNYQGYIEGGLRSGYRCANEVSASC